MDTGLYLFPTLDSCMSSFCQTTRCRAVGFIVRNLRGPRSGLGLSSTLHVSDMSFQTASDRTRPDQTRAKEVEHCKNEPRDEVSWCSVRVTEVEQRRSPAYKKSLQLQYVKLPSPASGWCNWSRPRSASGSRGGRP